MVIVVDKLLTGFDAPKNTALYLARMREHNLLQAVVRVNRVSEGKEYGYIIDYEGVLGELDEALRRRAAKKPSAKRWRAPTAPCSTTWRTHSTRRL